MNAIKDLPKSLAKQTNGQTNGTTSKPAELPKLPTGTTEKKEPEPTTGAATLNGIALNFPNLNEKPIDDRMHRLNQLFDLQGKYNKLQNSLQKLNEFELQKNSDSCSLSLEDDNGNDFNTSNSEIIKEVTDFLKLKIREKIKHIEDQIKW